MKKTFLMIVGFLFMMSTIVFAETYDISEISKCKVVTDYSRDTSVEEMDTVMFGSDSFYDQSEKITRKEPIEWIVLEKDGSKALLFSKYALNCRAYNNIDEPVSWETCELRKYLNNEFYNKYFDDDEQQLILDTVLDNSNLNFLISDEMVICANTIDKVFLLSILDVKNFFGWYDDFIERTENNISVIYPVFRFYENIMVAYLELGKETSYNRKKTDKSNGFWLRGNSSKKKRTFTKTSGETYDAIYISTVFGGGKAGYFRNPDRGKTGHILGNRRLCVTDGVQVRPALWVSTNGTTSSNSTNTQNSVTQDNSNANNNTTGGTIAGLPSRESELRSDQHFYLDNNMQKNSWVYYRTYYYHVDGSGNIQKSQWIELRYVGADGRMYRGRQTPDGKWVGDDGLVVDTGADLSKSLTIEAAEPDSWYKTQSGLWYYFENDRTTTKKGWFTDSRDSQTYYLDPQTGIMAVGWTNIGGSLYYFNESHDNENNWYETGGGFYESYGKKTKAYGSMFKNEMTPDGRFVDEYGKVIQ